MSTGKARGFAKGDFVWTGAFPGIIISDVHTFAPCCEVWGFEHEMGSAYAEDLIKMEPLKWAEAARKYGFDGTAYAKESKAAIQAAGIGGQP